MRFASLAIGVITTLAVVAPHVRADYVDEVLADSPLVYLQMNETTGTVADDASLNNNDGDYQNGVTLGGDGLANSGGIAPDFDGVDDRVQVLGAGVTGDYTVEAWIKVGSLPTEWSNIVYRTNTAAEDSNFSHLLQLGSTGTVLHYTYDGAARLVTSSNTVGINTWNHVVGVFDPVNDFMSVWLNGVETVVTDAFNDPTTSGNEWLAGQDHSSHGYFNGQIDDLAVYDTALSDARVTAHFEAGTHNLINNGSFESADIGSGAAVHAGATEWTHSGATAGYLLDNTPNNWFASGTPDGNQAFTLLSGTGNSSFISQQLNDDGAAVLSKAGLEFKITFNAGRRSDAWGDTPGTFTVLLQEFDGAAWTTVDYASQSYFLGADDGNANTIDLDVAQGEWSDLIELFLTIPGDLAGGLAGRNIRLTFLDAHPTDNGQAESSLDNITITLVPAPAALPAGLAMLGGVAMRRRRPTWPSN